MRNGNASRRNNYYTLNRPNISLWQVILYLLKIPVLLPRWGVSFLLARSLTNITLNPTHIKKQRPIHLVYLSDDPKEKGIVIVNLLPHEDNKVLHDYLLKFNGTIVRLPFINNIKNRQLIYKNPEDRAHIDQMIHEIDLLITGNSKAEKCAGKQFDWENIHFKGCECLDPKLHAYFLEQLSQKYGEVVFKPRKTTLDFFTLVTPDNASLDSVSVLAEDEASKPMSARKFVIACMARDQNYIDWIKDFNYSAQQIGCTVIGFNYRGIDYSKGMVWTQDNMINDVIAQVKRLLALGAKPENIGIEGMCLGGAVATIAAAALHQQNLRVKLYNERSFRTFSRLMAGYIFLGAHNNPWNPINWLRYMAAGLVYVICAPIIWLAGWNMDAAAAWEKIPQADKDYAIIRDHTNTKSLEHEEDSVVEDSWASMASLIDEKYAEAAKKRRNGYRLSNEEEALLIDLPKNHHFTPAPEVDRRGNPPDHLARRHLIPSTNNLQQSKNEHMHNHMVMSFRRQFNLMTDDARHTAVPVSPLPITYDFNSIKRPLFIACSGGTGHISAVVGIMDSMRDNNKNMELTQYQARLYIHRPFSIISIINKTGVFLMSLKWIGGLFSRLARVLNLPTMPSSSNFWQEMAKLEKAETATESKALQGRKRKYVDMLLDIYYPDGYEAASIFNTLQRQDRTDDIQLLVKHARDNENLHYKTAYKRLLNLLLTAAEKGQAYTEIISTQPLSIAALCDAVKYYNETYLAKKNKTLKTPLPTIAIHQYMSDLPSLGCDHFLDTISKLSIEQRQQMHLYAVSLNQAIVLSYLEGGQDFKGIHNILPHENPMVRAGFKDKDLIQYLDTNTAVTLHVKAYKQLKQNNWVAKNNEQEEIDIPARAKVASIMLGSLASDASIAYVKQLLDGGYDKIFVFGGLNSNIYQPVENIINAYPINKRQSIRERVIRLGNQDDREIAPIMTRSDCVVIRSGGLSVMEQMALPANPNKTVLLHQKPDKNNELSSGLSWEDGNADRLIDYLKPQGLFIRKTSPKRVSDDLKAAHAYHLKRNLPRADEQQTTPEALKPSSVRPLTPSHNTSPFFKVNKAPNAYPDTPRLTFGK